MRSNTYSNSVKLKMIFSQRNFRICERDDINTYVNLKKNIYNVMQTNVSYLYPIVHSIYSKYISNTDGTNHINYYPHTKK